MREIIFDEATFATPLEAHAYLARELGFPSYYGANLDALNDCLSDVDEPVSVTVYMDEGSSVASAADTDAPFSTDLSASPADDDLWFPKIVRSLLRAARANDALDVAVHAVSLGSFGRLCAVPGLCRMLDSGDAYIVQGIITCIR